MSDGYRVVTARFRGCTPKAIFVEKAHARGQASIPRSLMHAADDLRVEKLRRGDEFTFRLRDWKAEELGFA